jgi:hypothetical protein
VQRIVKLTAVGAMVLVAVAACNDKPTIHKPVIKTSPSVVVPTGPLKTIVKDGYYVSEPVPAGVNKLSGYPRIAPGDWNLPDGCAVTVYDAKMFATAQETSARQVYTGVKDKTFTVEDGALVYTHGCAGLEWFVSDTPSATDSPSIDTHSTEDTDPAHDTPAPTEAPSEWKDPASKNTPDPVVTN